LRVGTGLALAVVSLAAPADASEHRRLTLQEALALAEKAPLAQASALEVQRVRGAGRGAGLWPNPEVQFDREAAGEEVERIAGLSVALPVNGRLGLERSAARSALTAAESRARQDRIERRARVREMFIELVAAQERDRVLEAGLARLAGLVNVLRAREAEGESSGYDRMRAEQDHAELTAERLGARAALARAQTGLASLLGLSTQALVAEGTIDAPTTPVASPDEARAQAAARGDVEAFAAEADERELLSRASGRRALPEPALVVGRKTSCAAACESGATLGFAVSLPLFDHGQGPQAALRAEADLARTRRHILVLAAQADTGTALADVQAGRDAEAALAQAPSAERLIAIAQAAYEDGEMRVFELLDAHRTALSASLRAIEIRLATRKAELALDVATGTERLP